MKKQLILKSLTLFIFLIIISCEKEEFDQTNNNFNNIENRTSRNEYEKLYNDILSIDDLNEQKIVLSSFSFETQTILWQFKLNNYIENNNLNQEQLQIINKLKKLTTTDNLINVRNKNNTKLIQDVDELRVKIINAFDKNIGWYLINRFENINQSLAKIELNQSKQTDPNDNTIGDCNCTKDSDCVRLTGIGFDGFSWEYGTCEPITCYSYNGWYFGLFENENNKECVY